LSGYHRQHDSFTVAQSLAALPADRRAALKLINENLPNGYEGCDPQSLLAVGRAGFDTLLFDQDKCYATKNREGSQDITQISSGLVTADLL